MCSAYLPMGALFTTSCQTGAQSKTEIGMAWRLSCVHWKRKENNRPAAAWRRFCCNALAGLQSSPSMAEDCLDDKEADDWSSSSVSTRADASNTRPAFHRDRPCPGRGSGGGGRGLLRVTEYSTRDVDVAALSLARNQLHTVPSQQSAQRTACRNISTSISACIRAVLFLMCAHEDTLPSAMHTTRKGPRGWGAHGVVFSRGSREYLLVLLGLGGGESAGKSGLGLMCLS